VLRTQSLSYRIEHHTLTSVELMIAWGLIGVALYGFSRWQARRSIQETDQDKMLPKIERQG